MHDTREPRNTVGVGDRTLGPGPVLVGVLNVTPDSFSDGGDFLAGRAGHAIAAGVEPENIILDPGIGFGKTLEHNLALLRRLDSLVELGFPVLFGASRKRFIGRITGVEDARDRVSGTMAANVLAYERGATFFRVHDVRPNREALAVAEAVRRGSSRC